ncbi:hypothetical protein BDZ89DRAFT_1127038 [Hymenopellis radicata]|nr:hypothetical protein BDZ89DRAFT_1127038 [Hymenopellis radicata]
MPRIVSAICQLLHFPQSTLPIIRNGIIASTAIFPFDEKRFKIRYNEMDGRTHGPSPRPPDEHVPIFDGQNAFAFCEYHKLPRLHEELQCNDIAIIAFSVAGELVPGLNPVALGAHRVRMNVAFVILLHRPTFASPSIVNAPHWVIDEKPLSVRNIQA